jgi:hypothetical protein
MSKLQFFYIIYKITNKINGKFYIGTHKTNDINDDYWGSGTHLKRSIQKYGIQNFKKEILHVFLSKKEAFSKEKELVTEKLVQNPMCYNLTIGGCGGFHHIRKANKHKSCKNRKVMHDVITNKNYKVKNEFVEKWLSCGFALGPSPVARKKMADSAKKRIQTEEHKQKNSQTKQGTCVLRNLITNKCKFVKKEEIEHYLNKGWIKRESTAKGARRIHNPLTDEQKNN